MMNERRMACIACGGPLLGDVVVIGDQYPSAVFVSKDTPPLEASSLNVTKCMDCNLVQLSHSYDLQYVFDHYPYESGMTASMKGILQDVVEDTTQMIPLCDEDVVLDIGGNDGTLLGMVEQPVRARVNIDAAAEVKQTVSDRDYKHIHAKFSADVYRSLELPNPKLIFSVAMFYHLNDPLTFCQNVKEIMSDDTVWVLQMTYLGTMLRDNILDNIVHEHSAYYSLASLEHLLSRIGLLVAEARIVKSYGGSLRVFVVKDPSRFPKKYWKREYKTVWSFESSIQTNTDEALYAFNTRVHLLRHSIGGVIEHLVKRYGPLWGFGASTKGNMLLQFLGVGVHEVSCILDNSPKKIGLKTIGSKIPIVDESTYLQHLPKYLFILPYYYTSTFIPIIQKHIPINKQVYLFVPLPYPHFVTVYDRHM